MSNLAFFGKKKVVLRRRLFGRPQRFSPDNSRKNLTTFFNFFKLKAAKNYFSGREILAEKKEQHLGLVVEPATYIKLKLLAEKEDISLGALVRKIIKSYLRLNEGKIKL